MTTVSPEDAEKKFAAVEKCFCETEADIKAAREFIAKYKAELAQVPVDWRCYGWSGRELIINLQFTREPAKEIARLFGVDGWKRRPHHHTCGAIDWSKQVDGFTVTIEHAEQIAPKLIEEVKLQ